MGSHNEALLTNLAEMTVCVVKESKALTALNLANNNFCGAALAQILKAIRSND